MVARVYSSPSAKRKEQGQLVALIEAQGGKVFLSGRGREATRSGGTRPPCGKSGREWKGSLQTRVLNPGCHRITEQSCRSPTSTPGRVISIRGL